MSKTTSLAPRKPGRPKSGHTVQSFSVMLPPWLHEWAMQHPEGLSGLVRRLLVHEFEQAHPRHQPVSSLAKQ